MNDYLKGGEMVRVDGVVWCHTHGEVHDDTTSPYDEVGEDRCTTAEHRPVYFRARRGDYR